MDRRIKQLAKAYSVLCQWLDWISTGLSSWILPSWPVSCVKTPGFGTADEDHLLSWSKTWASDESRWESAHHTLCRHKSIGSATRANPMICRSSRARKLSRYSLLHHRRMIHARLPIFSRAFGAETETVMMMLCCFLQGQGIMAASRSLGGVYEGNRIRAIVIIFLCNSIF